MGYLRRIFMIAVLSISTAPLASAEAPKAKRVKKVDHAQAALDALKEIEECNRALYLVGTDSEQSAREFHARLGRAESAFRQHCTKTGRDMLACSDMAEKAAAKGKRPPQ
jgi:hypothetical protein